MLFHNFWTLSNSELPTLVFLLFRLYVIRDTWYVMINTQYAILDTCSAIRYEELLPMQERIMTVEAMWSKAPFTDSYTEVVLCRNLCLRIKVFQVKRKSKYLVGLAL